MAKFANVLKVEEVIEIVEPPTWNLFVDGSARKVGSGVGMILISPKGHKLNCEVRFQFKAPNNVAVYEVLFIGLRLAKAMRFQFLGKDSSVI